MIEILKFEKGYGRNVVIFQYEHLNENFSYPD